jgi:hypothetical protein
MKKKLFSLLVVLVFLFQSTEGNAFFIQSVNWAARTVVGGVVTSLPVTIGAGSELAGFTYLLTGAGLASMIADMALEESFFNDNTTVENMIKASLNASGETWTKNNTTKKYESNINQHVPHGGVLPTAMLSWLLEAYISGGGTEYDGCTEEFGFYYENKSDALLWIDSVLATDGLYPTVVTAYRVTGQTYNLYSEGSSRSYCGLGLYTCVWIDGQWNNDTFFTYESVNANFAQLLPFPSIDSDGGTSINIIWRRYQIYYNGSPSEKRIIGVMWSNDDTQTTPYGVDVSKLRDKYIATGVPEDILANLSATWTDFFANPNHVNRSMLGYGDPATTAKPQIEAVVTAAVPAVVSTSLNTATTAMTDAKPGVTPAGQIVNQTNVSEGGTITTTAPAYNAQRQSGTWTPTWPGFATRFSDFIAAMRTTGLFSLGSGLWTVPTTDVCTKDIDLSARFGGIYTVDFCDWMSIFQYFRTMLLLVASYFAIKIVFVKGG